jgi:hypothetical protein
VDYALNSASQRAFEESTILVACYHDDMGLRILRNQLLQCSEFIVQKSCIHQQHVGMLSTDRVGKTLWIRAFSENPNIALIGDRSSHPDEREWLIVRKNNIDTGHMLLSLARQSRGDHQGDRLNQNEFQGDEQ